MFREKKRGVAAIALMAALIIGGLALTLSSAPAVATVYVATTGSDTTGDGSAGNPYRTIQKGISVATDGDTVQVAAGTYVESFTWMVRDRRLVGEQGAILQGTLTLQRIVATAKIEGLTFQGGSSSKGGAVNMTSSNLNFVNCQFIANSANEGGAVWASMSDFRMEGCTLSGNSATGAGGAIYLVASSPILTGCTFSDNSAGSGTIYAIGGKPIFSGNTVSGNTGVGVLWGEDCLAVSSGNKISGNTGAGLTLDRASSKSVGDTISGNTGDGVYASGGTPLVANAFIASNAGNGVSAPGATYLTVINSTVSVNASGGLVGGKFPTITNCILWGNSGAGDLAGGAMATYSDIGTGDTDPPGTGNISEDPLFVGGGDYHLQRRSPCINVGNNDAVPVGVTTDIDGEARIVDSVVDMGADEYQQPPHQPDMRIKQGANWLGDDVYNDDGTDQTGTQMVVAGKTVAYLARLYNDGAETETFWIKGPAGNDDWTVRYFQGATDVTAQVTSETGWKRTNVPVGAVRPFTVKVTPRSGLASGSSLELLVQAQSDRDPAQQDTLKVISTVPNLQPDLWIKQGTNWLGDDVYNDDGTDQTGTQSVTAGATAVYQARLYNDGEVTETFWIKGPSGNMNWTAQYFQGTTDVTAQVISANGWKRPNVTVGAMRPFTIKVTPRSGAPVGMQWAVSVRAKSDHDPNQRDTIKAVTKVK